MKKFLVIFFALGLITQLFAQKEIANPANHDSIDTPVYNTTFTVRHNGETKTLTWYRLNQLLGGESSLLSQTNNWTAAQTYKSGLIIDGANSGYLQLSTTKVGSYPRQMRFDASDSTIYITDASGDEVAFKGQSYGDDKYATASGATDLPATYMTLATGQTVTGNKTVSSTYDFTNGSIKIPYKTGHLTANSTNSGKLYYLETGLVSAILDDDQGAQYRYDFVSKSYADANYTTISNYIPATGTKLDNTSTLKFTSGSQAFNRLKIGVFLPSSDSVLSFYNSGSSSLDGLYYRESGTNYQMPTKDVVLDMIYYYAIKYDAPTTKTESGGEELSFSASFLENDQNAYYIYNNLEPVAVTLTDMSHGRLLALEINDCSSNVTFSASGWTIEYPEQGTPTFSDGKQYKVTFECMGNSKIWAYVVQGN